MGAPPRVFDFDESSPEGERLDRFLTENCSDLSRSRVQQLIEEGHATVDGLPAKPATRLHSGQRIRLTLPDPAPSRIQPQAIPLNVVREDADILVIDKPAGMAVHPGPGNPDSTVVNAVLAHCPDLEGVGGELRPGIVHRLDKNTSGLLVIAKNDNSLRALAAQFKVRTVKKVYLALVRGHPPENEAIVDAPIGRHPTDRQRMAVVSSGRRASTRYRTLKRFRSCSLIEARPRTGRTHQIRVHMAAVGHPLVGDETYGTPEPRLGRHFLHASGLGIEHPSSGEDLKFTSLLPAELEAFLESLDA